MNNRESTIELNVEGMTCSNCALGISRFLENKGLKNVNVNLEKHTIGIIILTV